MKKIILSVALGLMIGISGFLGYKQLFPQLVGTRGTSFGYAFDDLVQRADVIARVRLQGNTSQVLTKDAQGLPYDYYTFSTVHAAEVFKGNAADSFKIVEPYAVWRQVEGAQILSTGGYTPLKKGGEYILFLVKSNQHPDTYEVVGGVAGKYLVTTTGLADPDVPLDGAYYRDLHQTVKQHYMKK